MQCAIQECYNLCACAGSIGLKVFAPCAACNAVFCRPKHCIMVIIRCIHIHKRIFCRNHRGLLAAPQEGNNLSTGARSVGGEGCSGCTAGNAVFDCPQYRITIVGIRRYICERASLYCLVQDCLPLSTGRLPPARVCREHRERRLWRRCRR